MITKCPDCGGELENGCMMDSTYGGVFVQRYAKSEIPKTSKIPMRLSEADFYDIRRVVSHRCTKCNRIFSYAQDIIIEKNLPAKQIKMMFWIFGLVIVLIIGGILLGFFI